MRVWEEIFKLQITKAYSAWDEHAPPNKLEKYKRPIGKNRQRMWTDEEMTMGSKQCVSREMKIK